MSRDQESEKDKNCSPLLLGVQLDHDSDTRARGSRISRFLIIFLPFAILFSIACLPSERLTQSLKPWPSYSGDGGWKAESRYRDDEYLIGVGKADITGPCVEINLMGYADLHQIGTGLRQRLHSRAFIIADPVNPSDRFIYLVLDTQSGDTAVRYGILSGLQELGPEYAVYGHHNLAVTGTHSHSGPGAWLNYLLPQITSKGFDQQSYRAIVDGALLSIRHAHESLTPGHVSIGSTKVFGANINRSLFAYLANPEEERARYNISSEDDGSVEKDLTMLKFQQTSDGKNIGVLTWFPTHGTSMLGNNTLVSGDNKGLAAYLFEKSVIGDNTAAEEFVAGFSQASVGDTSPNVLGAWCEDGSGQTCSFENSTCSNGRSQHCHARGPLFTVDDQGTSSCFEIGKRQFEPAKKLYDQLNQEPNPIRGGRVKSFHTFHNMSNHQFELPNGTEVRTCPAALGYSFAAGTSDGPGVFDFTQHNNNASNTSPVWRVVGGILKNPTQEQIACHAPKPILLDVGEVSTPYQWTPNVVDVQVFRVGQLIIIISPGEATTMAGRRWKNAVANETTALFAKEALSASPVVVLGGPANSYTHYITTEEEYGIQRYEGASTLYGSHTLAAYINVTLSWVSSLSSTASSHPPRGPEPPDNSNRSLSFIPRVIHDSPPLFRSFGDVQQDVEEKYQKGAQVTAKFVGANPRNNLRLESNYAVVEKLINEKDRKWKVVRDDSDWYLVFRWRRTSELLGTSEVEITWEAADPWAEPGRYRIRYFGDAKSLAGQIIEFEGVSGEFELVDDDGWSIEK
ncbi:Neutral/alkaline nonlysosomal ceramidase [Daldinia caldariorum]|uniref:Neutral/alkaline nonlysosomal ceramidase n=1 Tax=Daldinia caldariorum TaxID=326644 RepID=UPI002008ABF7|nr:Neutral/alkaline nonlysosomal ceramidase [Daldinia caldariorum]KAI1463945.1 Neutral/alkaline nonlysosomal ceramidase [Daldinia caldariorum]